MRYQSQSISSRPSPLQSRSRPPLLMALVVMAVMAALPLARCSSGGGGAPVSISTATGTVVAECGLCPICCVSTTDADGKDAYLCTDDQLTCKLKPKTDFSVLLTTLLIILGFAIGIPLIVFVIDFLVIRRPCNSKMSICEFCVNYLCLCICCKKAEKQKQKIGKPGLTMNSRIPTKDGNEEQEKL